MKAVALFQVVVTAFICVFAIAITNTIRDNQVEDCVKTAAARGKVAVVFAAGAKANRIIATDPKQPDRTRDARAVQADVQADSADDLRRLSRVDCAAQFK